jgi:hypothetical protein
MATLKAYKRNVEACAAAPARVVFLIAPRLIVPAAAQRPHCDKANQF